MRFIRSNFVFIVCYLIALLIYLNEIEVLKPLLDSKSSPDYLKSTLRFILMNMGIGILYYLNEHRQVIIDKVYELYEKNEFYDEEAVKDSRKFNQKAIQYINSAADGFFAPVLKPLEYQGELKYQDLLFRDRLEVKHSRLFHLTMGVIMISIPIHLASQVDYSNVEGIFYVYFFGLTSTLISTHNFYNFYKNPTLFIFDQDGLEVKDHLYEWNQIEFGLLNWQNKNEYLSLKLVGKKEPLTIYESLGELSISRKALAHCFEHFHRKYSDKKTGA